MTAEQIIKQALDGWFFVYNDSKQKTIALRASDYSPPEPKSYIPPPPHPNTRIWTDEENDALLAMFEAGLSFEEMGNAIGVSKAHANMHFHILRKERGLEYRLRTTNQKFSMELEAQVVHWHLAKGKMLREIPELVGLTRNQVVGLWTRWMRRQKKQEASQRHCG